ncbi:MAG: hypothetical protein FJZ56_02195 [Chlamydiae bacterium]|nr:hypothetical protein [Chlamydiota bacterium]
MCFVVNQASNTVQEIDLNTNRVLRTFSANLLNPHKLIITQDYIFVANYNSKNKSYFLDKIDRKSGQSVGLISHLSGTDLAINTRYKDEIYVSDNKKNANVHVIDAHSFKIIKSIPVGDFLGALKLSFDGKRLYVANRKNPSKISVIDVVKRTLIKTISIPNVLEALAITPDGRYLYAVSSDTNSFCGALPLPSCSSLLFVIDTRTYEVVSTIQIAGQHFEAIAIAPDGLNAYVTSYYDNCVYVIDTQIAVSSPSNAVIQSIAVGNAPAGIAITSDGKQAVVSNELDASVSLIDIQTSDVSKIKVGEQPRAIACF